MINHEEDTMGIVSEHNPWDNDFRKSSAAAAFFLTFFIVVCCVLGALLALSNNDLEKKKLEVENERALREEYEQKYKAANSKLIEISQDPLWIFYNQNSVELLDKR